MLSPLSRWLAPRFWGGRRCERSGGLGVHLRSRVNRATASAGFAPVVATSARSMVQSLRRAVSASAAIPRRRRRGGAVEAHESAGLAPPVMSAAAMVLLCACLGMPFLQVVDCAPCSPGSIKTYSMDSTLGDSGVASLLPKGHQSTSFVVTISDVALLHDTAHELQQGSAADELCVRVVRVTASSNRFPSVLPSMVVLQASTGVIVEALEAWEGTASDGGHRHHGFGLEGVWLERSKDARGRLRGFVDLLSSPVMDESQVKTQTAIAARCRCSLRLAVLG